MMEQYEPGYQWQCLIRDPERPHWAVAQDGSDGEVSLTHRCPKYNDTKISNVIMTRRRVLENETCPHCGENPSDYMIGLFLMYDWENA